MFKSKKDRESKEINAGSMADIAFLLLIFFLVTTTISADKGILVKLPPYDPNPPVADFIYERNVLSVKVNKFDNLLVEGEEMKVTELREMTKKFILNYGEDPSLSARPTSAIVSLQNDRSTSYEAYISVYNEIKGAYNEIWEEKSQEKYNVSYDALDKSQRSEIHKEIPLVISEAEPVEK